MIYMPTLISIIEVLLVTVPALLTVAFVTIAERKTMASMQRRLGPNIVGYWGLLQAFADALKLLLKEYVSPTQANLILFFLGPVITLIFSLLGYGVIPYGPGLAIADIDLGILYLLAVSSLATYGILLAGWSANSKYAFLGSLRSTAQLISYELILSSAILIVILLTGSLNLSINVEAQKSIWYIIPLLPVFIIFFIGSIAETNRAPFDLAEAESELVSGFMTEHAGAIFVFFFLAEYASIVLICILTSVLFLGGYLFNFSTQISDLFKDFYNAITYIIFDSFQGFDSSKYNINNLDDMQLQGLHLQALQQELYGYIRVSDNEITKAIAQNRETIDNLLSNLVAKENYIGGMNIFFISTNSLQELFFSLVLGLKTCIMIFVFIWTRASLPRIRFDQLMSFCWTILLPIVIAFIVLIPCIIFGFEIITSNSYIF